MGNRAIQRVPKPTVIVCKPTCKSFPCPDDTTSRNLRCGKGHTILRYLVDLRLEILLHLSLSTIFSATVGVAHTWWCSKRMHSSSFLIMTARQFLQWQYLIYYVSSVIHLLQVVVKITIMFTYAYISRCPLLHNLLLKIT